MYNTTTSNVHRMVINGTTRNNTSKARNHSYTIFTQWQKEGVMNCFQKLSRIPTCREGLTSQQACLLQSACVNVHQTKVLKEIRNSIGTVTLKSYGSWNISRSALIWPFNGYCRLAEAHKLVATSPRHLLPKYVRLCLTSMDKTYMDFAHIRYSDGDDNTPTLWILQRRFGLENSNAENKQYHTAIEIHSRAIYCGSCRNTHPRENVMSHSQRERLRSITSLNTASGGARTRPLLSRMGTEIGSSPSRDTCWKNLSPFSTFIRRLGKHVGQHQFF